MTFFVTISKFYFLLIAEDTRPNLFGRVLPGQSDESLLALRPTPREPPNDTTGAPPDHLYDDDPSLRIVFTALWTTIPPKAGWWAKKRKHATDTGRHHEDSGMMRSREKPLLYPLFTFWSVVKPCLLGT